MMRNKWPGKDCTSSSNNKYKEIFEGNHPFHVIWADPIRIDAERISTSGAAVDQYCVPPTAVEFFLGNDSFEFQPSAERTTGACLVHPSRIGHCVMLQLSPFFYGVLLLLPVYSILYIQRRVVLILQSREISRENTSSFFYKRRKSQPLIRLQRAPRHFFVCFVLWDSLLLSRPENAIREKKRKEKHFYLDVIEFRGRL